MSTTTALELLEHADVLTRRLRKSETQTTTTQWETFDDTLYRLLIELVGIEAQHVRTADPSWRALDLCPGPIRPTAVWSGGPARLAGRSCAQK